MKKKNLGRGYRKPGYAEKIQYWTEQLNTGVEFRDTELIERAGRSLEYFIGRHLDLLESGDLVKG